MARLLLWRLGIAIPLLLIVSFMTFVLIAVSPGDPAVTLLGDSATPERVAEVRAQLGLDRPLWEQYWSWLTAALRGDLGTSLLTNQPVAGTIWQRFGVTLSLVVGATIVSAVLGVLLGTWSALRGGS